MTRREMGKKKLTLLSQFGMRSRRALLRARGRTLLDLFVQRVTAQVWIVLLLLNAFRDGLLVTASEIAGDRFAFFFGFGAFEDNDFLHKENGLKGSKRAGHAPWRNPKFAFPSKALATLDRRHLFLRQRQHDPAAEKRHLARTGRDHDRNALGGDGDSRGRSVPAAQAAG